MLVEGIGGCFDVPFLDRLIHFWTIIGKEEQRSSVTATTHNEKTAASTMIIVECCLIVFLMGNSDLGC